MCAEPPNSVNFVIFDMLGCFNTTYHVDFVIVICVRRIEPPYHVDFVILVLGALGVTKKTWGLPVVLWNIEQILNRWELSCRASKVKSNLRFCEA